jgi:hypothetical protein
MRQIGGSARDYLSGFAWFGARYGPTRERLSVCLFIGALGVNFRICRDWYVATRLASRAAGTDIWWRTVGSALALAGTEGTRR